MSTSTQLAIRTVAVIGAGKAGRAFALACARAGLRVVLEDVMPSKLRHAEEEFQQDGSPLETASTVEDAVREADLAIDFVPDELESKLEIFSMLDRMAPPRTILCTPMESMGISDLASCTYRGDRCFAVRGLKSETKAIEITWPAAANAEALTAVVGMFEQMGFDVSAERDSETSVLTKNLQR